jgi:hypothetical protein
MEQCKPVSTPLPTSKKFSAYKGAPLSAKEATRYQSTVGGLKYLTLTRPDLSFLAKKVCQFLHASTTNHMKAAKRILRYVQGTITLGLKFRTDSSLRINAFLDADWVGCPDDRCSTGSFAIYLGSNLLSWSAHKQATVSHSSTEPELVGLFFFPLFASIADHFNISLC